MVVHGYEVLEENFGSFYTDHKLMEAVEDITSVLTIRNLILYSFHTLWHFVTKTYVYVRQ